ncbi:MAG: SUMF1/EgtB/PvdO family nonheme iron enzyme [Gammaproteobacteria bacterium]
MSVATELVDKKRLQALIPLNGLSKPHFEEVAKKGVVEELRAGKVLFKEGKRDGQTYFLLDGEVALLKGREIQSTVKAGTDTALHPLAPQQPRQLTARTTSRVTVLRIDTSLLDVLLAWDQSAAYEVTEIQSDDDEDWMTRMLQSELFARLPATNIQQMIMRMESVQVKAGDVIVEQDGEGDYYYIIAQGSAVVSRKPSANARPIEVARLSDGDSFGEESLLSGAKRNATVKMSADGTLMRLSKQDFDALLREPLINQVGYAEARTRVDAGALWLDVRLPGEYQNGHLPGSINLPLASIRDAAADLDMGRAYVVCCDTGTRSAGAAFLLSQRGFDTIVLEGGLHSVPHEEMAATQASAAGNAGAEIIDFKTGKEPQASDAGANVDAGERRLRELQAQVEREQARLTELQRRAGEIDVLHQEVQRLQAQLKGGESRARELEQAQRTAAAALGDVDKLRAHLAAVQGELKEGHAERDGARDELKRARQAYQQELANLNDRLQALEAERAQLEAAADDQGAAQSNAEQALQTLRQERDAMQSEHEGQLRALRQELDEVRRQASERRQAREQLEQQLAELQSRQQRSERDAQDQHRGLEDENQRLQSELEQQRRSRDEAATQLEALRGELEQRRAEFDRQLQQAHDEADHAARELSRRVETLEGEKAGLEADLRQQGEAREQELRRQLDELQSQFQEQESERQRLAAEAEAREAARAELEQALAEARTQAQTVAQDSDERIQSLQRDLERLQAEREQQSEARERELSEQLEVLRGQLNDAAAARESLERQLRETQESGQQASAELNRRIEALTEEKAQREAELEQQGDAREQELREQLDSLQARLGEADADRERLQGELAGAADTRQQMEAALAEVRDAADASQSELTRRIQELEQERDQRGRQAAADAEAAEARVQDLQQQLDGLQEQLQQAREAGQAAERQLAALHEAQDAGEQEIRDRLSQLEQENGSLAGALEQERQARAGADARVAELRQERDDTERAAGSRLQKLQDQLDQMQVAEQELQERLAATERQRQTLEQQHGDAVGELERLTATHETSANQQRGRIEELEQALAALEDKVRQAQAGRDTAESALENAEDELGALKHEMQTLSAKLDQASDEGRQLRGQRDEAAAELERLSRELEERASQEEVDTIRAQADKELRQAADELTRLQEELVQANRRTNRSEAKLEEALTGLRVAEHRVKQLESELVLAQQVGGENTSLQADLGQVRREVEEQLARYKEESDAMVQEARAENAALRDRLETLDRARDADPAPATARRAGRAAAEAPSRLDEVFNLADVDHRLFRQEQQGRRGGRWMTVVVMVLMLLLGAGVGGAAYWYLQGKAPALPFGAGTPQQSAAGASRRGDRGTITEPVVTPRAAPAPATKPKPKPAAAPASAGASSVEGSARAPALPSGLMKPGRTYQDFLKDGSSGPVMVQVAAGSFDMGSPRNSPQFNERPQHRVKVPGFSISKYEVTFDEYDHFAEATGRSKPEDGGWGRGQRPVVNVTWADAVAYAQWLSEQTGHEYRLPSEAQWEYAARAGTRTDYWWGDAAGKDHADCFNCGSRWDGKKTAPVGSFKANALGLYDTAGNAAEWLQDCYHPNYDGAPTDGSAWTGQGCSQRVIRGGSYRSPVDNLRSTQRSGMAPDTRVDSLGFRLVRLR